MRVEVYLNLVWYRSWFRTGGTGLWPSGIKLRKIHKKYPKTTPDFSSSFIHNKVHMSIRKAKCWPNLALLPLGEMEFRQKRQGLPKSMGLYELQGFKGNLLLYGDCTNIKEIVPIS